GWESLLVSAGYRFVWFDGLSRFYVAEERYTDLGQYFELPVNVFDDFVRYDSASENKIAALTKTVRAQSDQLADRLEQLGAREQRLGATEQRLTATEQWLAAAERAFATSNEQRSRVEAQLTAVYASTSWRVTAPLRSLSRTLRAPFVHGGPPAI